MAVIQVKSDLIEQIEGVAGRNGGNTQEFVDKAIRIYLAQCQREKIRVEAEAFERQRDFLLSQYAGEYVAINEGQVIDHDEDLRSLHLRVHERLGRVSVLLRKVSTEPSSELIFRSPRFEATLS